MYKRILIAVSLILAFAGAIVFDSAQYSSAINIEEGKDQTICHFDNNVQKPYGPKSETVDINSIIGESGHSGHDGPLATDEAAAQVMKDDHERWGDIIPSFDYTYTDQDGRTQTGHYAGLNYDAIGQAMIENNCQYVSEVVPTGVVFGDATCDNREGSYTIPSDTHIKYYLDSGSSPIAAGEYAVLTDTSVEITAKADTGYYIGDSTMKTWTHSFHIPTDEECVLGAESVTPSPVVFTPPTCEDLGYYTIPTTNGIKYYIGGEVVAAGNYSVANGSSVTVTAVADDGFEIKPGATKEWSYTFTARTDCVLGAESVTPNPIIFTPPTCEDLGYYTVPTTSGIKYYVNGKLTAAGKYLSANGVSVVVTAVADNGFEIKPGSTSRWAYTFTARTDCVLGASTTVSALPTTSTGMTSENAVIALLSAAIVAVLAAFARVLLTRRY